MSLIQLIYASTPFGFDEGRLNAILASARMLNARDGITGALICRADLYLQLLEGGPLEVENTFERIKGDDRHYNVTPLYSGPAAERMFSNWAMRHDPARSWLWTPSEVADGMLNRASGADLLAAFARVAASPATTEAELDELL